MLNDLVCADCNVTFSSAALLLKHFAQHVSESYLQQTKDLLENQNEPNIKKASIPDLYPISSVKTIIKKKSNSKIKNGMSMTSEDNEENIDSGIEDMNPLRFCSISMENLTVANNGRTNLTKLKTTGTPRKYKCSYCLKTFGWSTDLKRHILTHTGERPFRCSVCNSSFTRKFLLQKHENKLHGIGYPASVKNKVKIPPLQPIGAILKHKSRKQDKQKIKRKVISNRSTCKDDNYKTSKSLPCLLLDD